MTPAATFAFDAIGTAWKIELFDAVAPAKAAQLEQAIMARIDEYDRNYSRFRSDSWVMGLSEKAGEYILPPDAKPLIDMYQALYRLTDGAVTPFIGSTLSAAGYDAQYSLKPHPAGVTAPPAWDEAIAYDWPKLTVKQPVLLDFGAAGKGYLTDIIGELLAGQGIQDYYIDAGGDILYRGTQTIDVALEHPADPGMAIGVAHLGGGSLCGSSGNRRKWGGGTEQYHHILDPVSLKSPQHIAGLWVTARDGLTADTLTTALFFAPADLLQKEFNFEYAIVHQDMSLEHSDGFTADFFGD